MFISGIIPSLINKFAIELVFSAQGQIIIISLTLNKQKPRIP